jgi:hypothetical protein
MRRKVFRRCGVAGAAGLLIGLAVYAYAASNMVPPSRAGDGQSATSGYTVSNVAYTLDGANPQNLQKVEFDLDAGAATVKVLLQTGGSWFACTNTVGNHWSCSTPGQTVAGADQLRVVAVQ